MILEVEGTYGAAKKWVKQLTAQGWELIDYPEPNESYTRSVYKLRSTTECSFGGQSDLRRKSEAADKDNEGFNGADPGLNEART